jgi:hypothetical protein
MRHDQQGCDNRCGEWLRGLGLGQYEIAFRENEIDAEVLSDLTETDLEKLGLPLGHRKRLLKAIANLTARAELPGSSNPARASPAAQAAAQPTLETVAERRHVTVMFSDLIWHAKSARWRPDGQRCILRPARGWIASRAPKLKHPANIMGEPPESRSLARSRAMPCRVRARRIRWHHPDTAQRAFRSNNAQAAPQ